MGDIVSQGLRPWVPEYPRSSYTSWLTRCSTSGNLLNLSEPSVSKSVKWGFKKRYLPGAGTAACLPSVHFLIVFGVATDYPRQFSELTGVVL